MSIETNEDSPLVKRVKKHQQELRDKVLKPDGSINYDDLPHVIRQERMLVIMKECISKIDSHLSRSESMVQGEAPAPSQKQ